MPALLRWFLQLGPTNPIAVRLLSSGSRRSRHHYIRIGYLGLLIAVLLISLLSNISGDQIDYRLLAAAGARSFEAVAYIQIGLICVLAPVFMAGAIAQEADPRTWDILLTTPLSAGQVVLGNLTGRLFFILALLFSSLPLFAVTQYFGGVPGSSIFASYLIAACAALLVGSMAIALAVSRLAGRRAVFTFYVAVVSFIAITLAIDLLLRNGSVTLVTSINPFLAVNALLDPVGYARVTAGTHSGIRALMLESPITAWCVFSSSLSGLLLVLSTITVRFGGLTGVTGTSRASIDPNEGTQAGRGWSFVRRMRAAVGLGPKARRGVWINPIAWRESAGRSDGAWRMATRYGFIAIGLLWAIVLVLLVRSGSLSAAQFRLSVLFTLLGELTVICLVATNLAATSVSKEREDGTLDILLTTPIQPGQYLYGKLKGMIAYLIPMLAVPFFTAAVAGLYVLIDGYLTQPLLTHSVSGLAHNSASQVTVAMPLILPEAALIFGLSAVPFVAFCVVVGMLWSVRSKGQLGAVVATVGVVSVLGGIVGVCGWNVGSSIPVLGPALAGISPASAVFAAVFPEVAMKATVMGPNVEGARLALMIGTALAACALGGIVWAIKDSVTRTFDATTRKLAGLK